MAKQEKKNKNLLQIVKKNILQPHRLIPGAGLAGDAVKGGKKVYDKVTKKDEPKTRKGRKLSPYEMKQAERKKAMQDKARKRHEAWKKERAKKKEARKNRK